MRALKPVQITIVTPAQASRLTGNRVSGTRWSRILKRLGHRITNTAVYQGNRCDLLIALHAQRSHESIVRFTERYPERPLIVVLTGTDLYRDIHVNEQAQDSLQRATRLVVLQKMGVAELPRSTHPKTRVIYQSAAALTGSPGNRDRAFTVCVVGHLRSEKDPFRTAMAARSMPASSKLRILQIGRALSKRMGERAWQEEQRNPRYRWLGELPHWKTRRMLASSHLLCLTSTMEGSSNALCEALASSVPIVASRISGLIGTLGHDYPGYFERGDTRGLTRLLTRTETNHGFYESLVNHCATRAHLVDPERETQAWHDLIEEIT